MKSPSSGGPSSRNRLPLILWANRLAAKRRIRRRPGACSASQYQAARVFPNGRGTWNEAGSFTDRLRGSLVRNATVALADDPAPDTSGRHRPTYPRRRQRRRTQRLNGRQLAVQLRTTATAPRSNTAQKHRAAPSFEPPLMFVCRVSVRRARPSARFPSIETTVQPRQAVGERSSGKDLGTSMLAVMRPSMAGLASCGAVASRELYLPDDAAR